MPFPVLARYRAPMAHEHDVGYKLLFSAPEMVRDLLLVLAGLEWVQSADFATLCRVNGSYVSDDLRARHDDMVWKIRLRDEWFYVYLLLEFQSAPDRWMALRIQVYVGLLYQDLVARRELGHGGMLPPVLPIVLYNGHAPWHSARSLDELLMVPPAGLAPYRVQARYLLIDQRRFDTADLPLRNLVAALFRLEAARTSADFRSVTALLLEWLSGDGHQRIRRAFAIWLNRRLRRRMPEANIPESDDLAEVHSMFPDNLLAEIERKARAAERKAHKKGLQEGRQEGLQEGRQEGRQEGEAMALLRLLERRFGTVAPELRQRIVSADLARIGQWFDLAIDAPDLETVFRFT